MVLTRLTITTKLSLLLLFFVLIFYGTIVHVFLHIQKMMSISEEIVSINNVVASQSKVLIENLLEMDSNAKKFAVLKKEVYRDYFESAQSNFNKSIATIEHLSSRGYTAPAAYSLFLDEFTAHINLMSEELTESPHAISWVDEPTLNTWLALLVQLRDLNQAQTEESLMLIHQRSLQSTQNGLLGFGFSVLAAIFGVWFVSKSILIPLKELTHGLRTLSQGDYTKKIHVTSKDEFHDLAIAYNEMNSELCEQENLRSDFIATLSHEIRTPLSSIQESVNMLTEEVLGTINEKQHKFLTLAGGELARITKLLNHLMHVSMLESSTKGAIATEKINPIHLILDCTESLSTAAEKKNISIKQHFQEHIRPVSGRREELQQIIINILGNALKFSPVGSEVLISVLKSEKSGYVSIEISDLGPGISDDETSLIFNKYYRSKSVRKHMDGVGLGLYISKRLAKTVGGTIQVKNNPDQGCTFTIMIPEAK